MSQQVKIRRGTAAQVAAFTPVEGELTYATDTKRLSVGDGLTAGGTGLAKTSEASAVEVQIHAATGKTTPADADEIGIVDSAASNVLKKLTWANLYAAIWTLLGAGIAGLTGKTTPVDADTFAIADSAASSATKKLTWANLKATLNTYFSGLGSLAIVAGDIVYGSATGVLSRLAKGSDGQVLTLASGVPAWATASAAGVTARNRIVNPAMQISSINGNTAGTTSGYVPADNWVKNHVSSAGTLTVQRVQSVTPKGAKDRIRCTVTVADASLASGEFLTLSTNLVGQEVADFQYGSASAKQSLLRFLFKGPAGTYAVHLGNSAANRSYVALFTISGGQANTDVVQTFTIVGDTTGTWLTDTGIGITLDVVLACGSTFQGTTGWQAGNLFGTSGVSNGMGTLSNVFEIGEVGFYLDVASLGTFPTWELPSDKANFAAVGPLVLGSPVTLSGTSQDFPCPSDLVPRRVTVSLSGVSSNGTSEVIIQLGTAGGVQATNYFGSWNSIANAGPTSSNATSGFNMFTNGGGAAFTRHGSVLLSLIDTSSGIWAAMGVIGLSDSGRDSLVAGSKTLSGVLTTVRLTMANGTDTFDAGVANVIWE